jgi:hypothetical protein
MNTPIFFPLNTTDANKGTTVCYWLTLRNRFSAHRHEYPLAAGEAYDQ